MRPEDIYVKTDQGREEIKTRQRKLSSSLRTLLIMIDGKTKAADIIKQTAQMGITAETMDQLLAQGFIAVQQISPAAIAEQLASSQASHDLEQKRFSDACHFMNETVVNASGLKSFMFTLKLEKCTNLRDLRELFPA
jgi:predicted membrane GTPase involved in stress response